MRKPFECAFLKKTETKIEKILKYIDAAKGKSFSQAQYETLEKTLNACDAKLITIHDQVSAIHRTIKAGITVDDFMKLEHNKQFLLLCIAYYIAEDALLKNIVDDIKSKLNEQDLTTVVLGVIQTKRQSNSRVLDDLDLFFTPDNNPAVEPRILNPNRFLPHQAPATRTDNSEPGAAI